MNDRLADVVQAIQERDGFILVGHLIPDGDCIGSLVAMQLALQSMGKHSVPLLEDELPPNYYFLPGAELITFLREGLDYSRYPHVIYLDCAEQSRIGERAEKLVAHTDFSINIDHHLTNSLFANVNLVADRAANGEVLYEVIKALGVTITPDIALALYTAIVMDTGNFNYAAVNSGTLRIAGDLLDCGADHNLVHRSMHESKDTRDLRMLGLALSHLDYTADLKLSWMSLSYAEAASIDAADLHPEGIVNFGRMIKGIEVALFFREVEPGTVKISLRSKGEINVARLAAELGGGGHTHAAGVKRKGDLEQVKGEMIQHFKEILGAN